MRIKLVWIVSSLVILLIGCSDQASSIINNNPMEQIGVNKPLVAIIAKADKKEQRPADLKQDIEELVKEKNIKLLISEHEGVFVPANYLFSQRIMDLLSTHGESISRSVNVDNYDLLLRFEGYEDIHLNLDLNSFWFAGNDHLYRVSDLINLSDQWNRHRIHLESGKRMYDSFEKTILDNEVFTDDNKIENRATLYYDGDIRLSINKAEIVIDPFVAESSLNASSRLHDIYSMKFLGEQPLIAVIHHFDTMRGTAVKLNLFSYTDQKIQTVFSSNDVGCRIEDISLKKGTVLIGLPFAKTKVLYTLTNQENVESKLIASKLKANKLTINEAYIKTIAENISCSPMDIEFVDVDKDGKEELLILANIYTVGAKTPALFNVNAVFIFKVMNNTVKYQETQFESDPKSRLPLFSYFHLNP